MHNYLEKDESIQEGEKSFRPPKGLDEESNDMNELSRMSRRIRNMRNVKVKTIFEKI